MSVLRDPFRRACILAALLALGAGAAEYVFGSMSKSDYLLGDAIGWLYSLAIYLLAAISYRSTWQRTAEFGLSAIFLIQGSQAAYDVVKGVISPSSTGARDIAIGSVGALTIADLTHSIRNGLSAIEIYCRRRTPTAMEIVRQRKRALGPLRTAQKAAFKEAAPTHSVGAGRGLSAARPPAMHSTWRPSLLNRWMMGTDAI